MLELGCDQLDAYLDAYLDGDLSPADAQGYAAHLATCSACRQAVALDRHALDLLAAARPVSPPGLVQRIDRRLRRERFVRFAQRSGLLAAAAALLALGLWAARFDERPTLENAPSVAVAPRPEVHVRFADNAPVIAMPLKTKNPRVSIVWVYPTMDAASASANEIEAN